MIFGRIIGWLLTLIGVAVAGHEVIAGLIAPRYHVIPLGELWYKLDAGSLNLVQAVVQRYISPWLWDNVIFHILTLPAWTVFAVPGVLLLIVFYRAGSRRRGRWG